MAAPRDPREIREVRDNNDEHAWEFNPELFIAHRSNPLIGSPGPDDKLDFNLNISYYGENFFFDEAIGYTLSQNDHYMFSLIASPVEDFVLFSEDFFETDKVPELQGLEERKFGINAGVELLIDGDWGDIALQVQTDLLGTHNGHVIDLAYAHTFNGSKWQIRPQLGVVWKSSNYVDYFYGISPSEASATLPEYTAGAALNPYFFLEAKYFLVPEWNLLAGYYVQHGDDSISDSPLVVKDRFLETYVGIEWVKPFSIDVDINY